MSRMEQKIFLADPELAQEIRDYRFAHRFKSEGAAVRTLVRAALDALKKVESGAEESPKLAA